MEEFARYTLGRIRLYVHDVFALKHWRKGDRGKEVSVVKITVTQMPISQPWKVHIFPIFLAWKQD